MVAGGMESMSNAPYYLKRGTTPYGKVELLVRVFDLFLGLVGFIKLNPFKCLPNEDILRPK